MYEHWTRPILSRVKFTKRVARHVMPALFVLGPWPWVLELSVTTPWESWNGWIRCSMLR
jgi:hypothetical protein